MNLKQRKEIIRKKLSSKIVGISGAGGLGSNVAVSLARSGVNNFIIVDFDRVEEDNLNRQYYFLSQVGSYKIEALKNNLENINKNIVVELNNQKLETGTMWNPFQRADVIVEALDNAETKTQFIDEILQFLPDKPLVAASGVAGYGNSDRIQTKQYGNLFLVTDEEAESSDNDVLLAPKVCLMANWQANIVLELLLGDI